MTIKERDSPIFINLSETNFWFTVCRWRLTIRRRAVNTFHLDYKNQSFYAVSGTSRCLFSDKYKIRKYSVGRAYSC